MMYISRVLEGIVKAVCSARNIPLKSEGMDRKLAELIDELGQKKIAGNRIVHILHNLRIYRNKNAHNESTSFDENMKLIRQARLIQKWFENISGQKSHDKGKRDDSQYVKISLNALMNEYSRNPSAASRKYDGKLITITGGTVQRVKRSEHSDEMIVTILSKYETTQSGASIAYKVDCFYPLRHEGRVRSLKEGQKFAATGIWKGRKLTGCVWSSDKVNTNSKTSKPQSRNVKDSDKEFSPALVFLAAAAVIIITILLGRN